MSVVVNKYEVKIHVDGKDELNCYLEKIKIYVHFLFGQEVAGRCSVC